MKLNLFICRLALLVGPLICSLFGCAKSDSDFVARFEHALLMVKNSSDPTVTISAITDFEWDNLLIFAPYTTVEKIQIQLGYKWNEAVKTHVDSSDGFNLLVFTKSGRVVRYFKISRQTDFKGLEARNMFTPGNDIFEVKLVGAGETARLDLFPKRKVQLNSK